MTIANVPSSPMADRDDRQQRAATTGSHGQLPARLQALRRQFATTPVPFSANGKPALPRIAHGCRVPQRFQPSTNRIVPCFASCRSAELAGWNALQIRRDR